MHAESPPDPERESPIDARAERDQNVRARMAHLEDQFEQLSKDNQILRRAIDHLPTPTRRRILKAATVATVGASAGGGFMAGRASAAASTGDSDGDVGLPSNRVDLFADGIDANSVAAPRLYTNSPPSVVVWTDGSTVYADGESGNVSTGTDAATVIQDAINHAATANPSNGGRVGVAAGNYTIASTLTIPPKLELVGVGVGSVLELGNSANTDLVKILANSDWSQIRQFHLKGNKSNNTSGSGVRLIGPVYRATLADILVEDFPDDGVVSEKSAGGQEDLTYELNVTRVQSNNNGSAGFRWGATADGYFAHAYAEKNTGDGFVESIGYNTYFHGHAFNNRNGVQCNPFSERIQFIGCHFENNNRRGVFIRGPTGGSPGQLFFDSCILYANGLDDQGDAEIEIHDREEVYIYGGAVLNTLNPHATYGVAEFGDADNNHIAGVTSKGHVNGQYNIIGPVSTINGAGSENLGTSPSVAPAGTYPEGTVVRNSNSDNNETWQLVRGTWVQLA